MDDLLDQLAGWSTNQTLADIPASVLQRAQHSVVDTIGVGLAGTRTEVVHRVRAWAAEQYQAGSAGVLCGPERLTPIAAALVNAVACHALDFDDTCYDGIVHASAVVLPAALAACEAAHRGGADVLLAYCVGCQVEIEIGRALTAALYDRGWFSTALLGALGAASAAAKGLGLSQAETRAALALATVEAKGIRAVLGSEAKPYLAGCAAETGVRCALLARAGLTAPAQPFDSPVGFVATHLDSILLPTREFGPVRWCFEDPGFALKLYPVCSAAQAAMEELLITQQELNLPSEEIARITAAGTSLVVRSLQYLEPTTIQEAQFSMQFALACILHLGELTPRTLTASTLQNPVIRDYMARVILNLDAELEARPDRDLQSPEGASLTIETTAGETFRRLRLAASGMPQHPLSEQQLWQKFTNCCAFGRSSEQSPVELYQALRELEEVSRAESIVRLILDL